MKAKIILVCLIVNFFIISSYGGSIDDSLTEWSCGTHNGQELFTGPKGGCYYYNSNDNKT